MFNKRILLKLTSRLGLIAGLAILLLEQRASRAGDDEKAQTDLPNIEQTKNSARTRPSSDLNAPQMLQHLLEGNARFVAGTATHPDQTSQRRVALTSGQTPLAIVLSCSDSRVIPEFIFDQGLGDLFVIRNAGNILDDHVLGSMEYAVEHLHVKLIVVIGHEKCGAVSAAVAGGEMRNHIHSVVDAITPSVEAIKSQPGDPVDNAVRANAQQIAETLTKVEPILNEAFRQGALLIAAARYDLATGQIAILKTSQFPTSLAEVSPH